MHASSFSWTLTSQPIAFMKICLLNNIVAMCIIFFRPSPSRLSLGRNTVFVIVAMCMMDLAVRYNYLPPFLSLMAYEYDSLRLTDHFAISPQHWNGREQPARSTGTFLCARTPNMFGPLVLYDLGSIFCAGFVRKS